MKKKIDRAIELTKVRLKKADPKYEKYFDVFGSVKMAGILACGSFDSDNTISLSTRYVELNGPSTISKVLIHEFVHYYLFTTQNDGSHGYEFNKTMKNIYAANDFKVRDNYTTANGNMFEVNAFCQHCGQEYHWSAARLDRYRSGAKFYCHKCYELEHKHYWLKSMEDITREQIESHH